MPWFWSNQYDCALQVAGLPTHGEITRTRRRPAPRVSSCPSQPTPYASRRKRPRPGPRRCKPDQKAQGSDRFGSNDRHRDKREPASERSMPFWRTSQVHKLRCRRSSDPGPIVSAEIGLVRWTRASSAPVQLGQELQAATPPSFYASVRRRRITGEGQKAVTNMRYR
ncbi:oxidoreductase C-terminal domain-containing protein [Rhizobium yanglingense]